MTHVMIHQDVMDKCRPVFDKEADDGWLDPSSLQECLNGVGLDVTSMEVELVIKQRGDDHKNGISFNSFVLLAMQLTELIAIRLSREEDALAAFSTLVNVGRVPGQKDGAAKEGEEAAVTGAQLAAVLAEFELKMSVKDIIKDADSDNNGVLDFSEFSAMLAEKPDSKMLSGAFRIGIQPTTASDVPFYYGGSTPAKTKKQDNAERMLKKSEKTKVGADENEETDETKIKKIRKNFNFMNSLHKQYKDKQSAPRSEASRLRTSKPSASFASSGRTSRMEGESMTRSPKSPPGF